MATYRTSVFAAIAGLARAAAGTAAAKVASRLLDHQSAALKRIDALFGGLQGFLETARVIILDKGLVLAAVLSDALQFAPLAVEARQVDRVDGGARGIAHFAHHERVGVGAFVFLLFGSGIDHLEGAAAKLLSMGVRRQGSSDRTLCACLTLPSHARAA